MDHCHKNGGQFEFLSSWGPNHKATWGSRKNVPEEAPPRYFTRLGQCRTSTNNYEKWVPTMMQANDASKNQPAEYQSAPHCIKYPYHLYTANCPNPLRHNSAHRAIGGFSFGESPNRAVSIWNFTLSMRRDGALAYAPNENSNGSLLQRVLRVNLSPFFGLPMVTSVVSSRIYMFMMPNSTQKRC